MGDPDLLFVPVGSETDVQVRPFYSYFWVE